MKCIVKNRISYGIIDKDSAPFCMKVEFKKGDEWDVSEGYCKIDGTKCCSRDSFFVRLFDEDVISVFGADWAKVGEKDADRG